MKQKNINKGNFALFAAIAGLAVFSLYVLLNTEKTVVVINEAVEPRKEVFIAGVQPSGIAQPAEQPAPEVPSRVEILETGVGFLNVRDAGSLNGARIGRVSPGEVYEYIEKKNSWYHITGHEEFGEGWISGEYAKEVDRRSDLFGEGE